MSSNAGHVACTPDAYADVGTYLADQLLRAELWYRREMEADNQQTAAGQRQESSAADRVDGQSSAAALRSLEAEIQQRADCSEESVRPLHTLAQRTGLSAFEVDIVLLLLAHELDPRFAAMTHYLQDGRSEQPSVELIIRLLCKGLGEALRAHTQLCSDTPLLSLGLVTVTGGGLYRTMTLNPRITRFVLASPLATPPKELADAVHLHTGGEDEPVPADLAGQIAQLSGADAARLCWLFGPSGAGKRQIAARVASERGKQLLVADINRLRAQRPVDAELMRKLQLEALMQNAVLFISGELVTTDPRAPAETAENPVLAAVRSRRELVFVCAARHSRNVQPNDYLLHLQTPVFTERGDIWQRVLTRAGLPVDDEDLARLAQFRFTPGQIKDAISRATTRAEQAASAPGIAHLLAACKHEAAAGLAQLSDRIEPQYGWQDLVVSADTGEQLRELCDQVRLRHRVHDDWGMATKSKRGRCIGALFSGPSGTGKTMAAEVIANALGMDLAKVDLASVVSKYVGETEKNLSVIFDEAQHADIVLYFDESDSLFGKRTEVKDSHDRYANIEINYLLQRMETFDGLLLLSTNQREFLDEAFTRRLRFCIEFEAPRVAERRRLWEVMLPMTLPRDGMLEFDFLAEAFEVTGGTIRNAALTAAFYAAGEDAPLSMRHLVLAMRREYQKTGRICTELEFGRYYHLVAEGERR